MVIILVDVAWLSVLQRTSCGPVCLWSGTHRGVQVDRLGSVTLGVNKWNSLLFVIFGTPIQN